MDGPIAEPCIILLWSAEGRKSALCIKYSENVHWSTRPANCIHCREGQTAPLSPWVMNAAVSKYLRKLSHRTLVCCKHVGDGVQQLYQCCSGWASRPVKAYWSLSENVRGALLKDGYKKWLVIVRSMILVCTEVMEWIWLWVWSLSAVWV